MTKIMGSFVTKVLSKEPHTIEVMWAHNLSTTAPRMCLFNRLASCQTSDYVIFVS